MLLIKCTLNKRQELGEKQKNKRKLHDNIVKRKLEWLY